MLAPLPEQIDILRLARQGSKLVGKQSLDGMARLRQGLMLQDDIASTGNKPVLVDAVHEHQQEKGNADFANVELEFGEDDKHIVFIKGKAQASVYMKCQRCLEQMSVELNASFLLGVVDNETRVEKLPEQYEPLVVSEKTTFLAGIIEDELILSLPLVALHEIDQCSASGLLSDMASQGESDEQENGKDESKLNNPFSVLSTLKK